MPTARSTISASRKRAMSQASAAIANMGRPAAPQLSVDGHAEHGLRLSSGGGRLETLKVREIPSGYDASQYVTERLMAPSRDGVMVPVSVVYRRDFIKNGKGRLHVYGYGAYGHAIPPGFSTNRLSLLDRGFACAIAHIRGGDDLGFQWYLDGKLDQAHQHLQRFRRCDALPDRPGLRHRRAASPRPAARRAAN